MVPKLGYCTTVLSTTVLTPLHSISYMPDDAKSVSSSGIMQSTLQLCHSPQYNYQFNQGHQHHTTQLLTPIAVASEAYHDWSGEAADAQLRVNFTLKLLLSQNFCNRPLMRFISFASNIGPAAAVPAGPAPSP